MVEGAQAAEPDAAFTDVEWFHAQSSNWRAGVLLRAPGVDWGGAPPPFKHYAAPVEVALPAAPAPAAGTAVGRAALAAVLWHTAGVTAVRGTLNLRAAPSSGALFSTELYVALQPAPGLEAGLWR